VRQTHSLLAACAGADSPVRKVVFKSSAHVYGFEPDAPAFLTEDVPLASGRRTELEQSIVDAEAAVAEFTDAAARGVTVTVVRCADPLGPELRGSHLTLFSLPVIPSMLGFDPRWQFIDEDDVVGVLAHAARHDLPGAYNAAADGVLALSEIASLLGKPLLPVLPPWGTGFAAAQLRRVGLRIPLETIRHMRSGRGLDNRRLKASGYVLRYTSREAVLKLRAQQRLRPLLGRGEESYRYEREVVEFLRWSPSVQGARAARQDGDNAAAPGGYEELGEGELISLISSLEPDALRRLRSYELAHSARPKVLEALDRNLARRASPR
jgi:UDP-glucose 4-epimerase